MAMQMIFRGLFASFVIDDASIVNPEQQTLNVTCGPSLVTH